MPRTKKLSSSTKLRNERESRLKRKSDMCGIVKSKKQKMDITTEEENSESQQKQPKTGVERLKRKSDMCDIVKSKKQKMDITTEEENSVSQQKQPKTGVERIKKLRECKEFREKERDTNKTRIQDLRSNNEVYNQRQRELNKLRMQDIRMNNEEYRIHERSVNKENMQDLRNNAEYKAHENAKNRQRIQDIRENDDDFNQEQRELNKLRMQDKREDEDNRNLERESNSQRMQHIRMNNEEYRIHERSVNKENMQDLRNNAEYKAHENAKNRQRIQNKRMDEEFSRNEASIDLLRKRDLRADDMCREDDRFRDKLARRRARADEILHFRDTNYNSLQESRSNPQSEIQLSFIEQRRQLPSYICSSCEGSFFQNGVVRISRENIIEKFSNKKSLRKNTTGFDESAIGSLILNHYDDRGQNYSCHTCYKYICRGEVPKLASSWGLKLPPVPTCISRLNDLEERMISPYVPFMDIRTLSNRASNPQEGMKGSVVHIPVEVNEIISSLPRNFDNLNMLTIAVDWKRRMEYQKSYMRGFVRPAYIIEALGHLMNTELYKKHGVSLDNDFLLLLENEADVPPVLEEEFNEIGQEEVDVDDEFYDYMYDGEDECLLFDFNEQTANNAVIVMAPGQNRYPVSAHKDRDVEYLSFPKIFAGEPRNITNKNVTMTDTIKWEIRYFNGTTTVNRLLYLAKMKLERDVLNTVQITMRKKVNGKDVTAIQALNPGFIAELKQHNDGLKFMNSIRNSPSYWSAQKKKLFAMIRQLGRPTFFLTVSAVETNWPELIQGLVFKTTGNKISLASAMGMPSNEKYKLIKEDPVYTARYYDHRNKELMKIVNHSSGPFSPYQVTDFYRRREFQQRGSPHDHILLFIEGAPQLDAEDPSSFAKVIEFVDQFITCEYDEKNPYCKYTRHKHTDTCSKGRRNKQSCRFNFPKFVMPETMILEPLPDNEKSTQVKENLQKIKDLMETFFKSKDRVYKEFDDILDELKMTKESYINAVRFSTTKLAIFYKRRSSEVDINTYNRNMLNLAEANTDLQFIVDEYAVARYLVEYIAKAEAGLSKGLKDCQEELAKGNRSLQEQFRCIANKFLNSNVMGASEAVYHCLGTSLSESSRAVIFINTSRKEDRVVFLKSTAELLALDPDSTDISGKNIIEHYSERTALDDVCLAEYAAFYFRTGNKKRKDKNIETDDEINDIAELDEIPNDTFNRRKKARIIRYVRYKLDIDPDNYYREQLLLFLPWRHEDKDIEEVNWSSCYSANVNIIDTNRAKLFKLTDDALDSAIQAANEILNLQDGEDAELDDDAIPKDQEIDILVQGGMDRPKNNTPFVYSAPPKIQLLDIFETLRKLNDRQREIVMQVYKSFTTGQLPVAIFISGSAGVGKSMVISTIFQLITHHLDYSVSVARDQQIESLKVLLSAFSGKAAFLIGGNTLHSAFALPLMECANMPDLPMDVANNLRQQLLHVKLIIIDEISMVGSTIFSRIDTRLRQITGVNCSFGGISLIVVGDFLQLSPVKDCSVFLPPKHSLIKTDISALWNCFQLYELTEVMRQKDDLELVHALNNFALGKMSDTDVEVFKKREVEENQVPDDAMRLYYRNADVEAYNDRKIASSNEPAIICAAVDTITGKLTKQQKDKKLQIWKDKPTKDCGGYPHTLVLKKGIKYMVTANLDVSDGLVNGATGTLEYVYCDPGTEKPKIVFLNFGSSVVGRKMRIQYKNFMENKAMNNTWTPIARRTYNLTNHFQKDYQAIRDQFPLVPCEALTIHKSQGQTYESVCVDFRKAGNLTRQLVYVAVSRVSKLSGLYILGKFPGNMKSNNTITSSLSEMERLRKERQLQLAYNNLENINGTVICYLNIRSLRKNIAHILADKWYSRCDILVFSETCTYPNEEISIPGFKVFYRSDRLKYPTYVKKNVAKGIMCFAKTGTNIVGIQTSQTFKRDDKINYHSHVDLVSFSLNDTLILTGYKSPKSNLYDFKTAFSKLNVNNTSATILLGDFNFNLNDTCSYQVQEFKKFMSSLHLNDCLQSSVSTTNLGSRLDVIFSNIGELQTGVYECYFSDHKPIFTILEENKSVQPTEKTLTMEFVQCEPQIELIELLSEDSSILEENKSVQPTEKPLTMEFVQCEPQIDLIELLSDDSSIGENDRKIECSSFQCSSIESDVDNSVLDVNAVDWVNALDAPTNIYDCTSEGLLENLRQIFCNNYETFVIPEELSKVSTNRNIMLYQSSIDHIANYLQLLPAVVYNYERDILFSDQILDGFCEIPITGDGNCQFNSISYSIVGNEQFAIDLRAIAFQSVMERSQFFQELANESILESLTVYDLLKICCEDRQWGNTDTLFALSMKLERIIIILQIRNGKPAFMKIVPPTYNITTSPIVLHLHNAGSNNAHYNVLLPHDINTSYEFPCAEVYNLSTILNYLRNT